MPVGLRIGGHSPWCSPLASPVVNRHLATGRVPLHARPRNLYFSASFLVAQHLPEIVLGEAAQVCFRHIPPADQAWGCSEAPFSWLSSGHLSRKRLNQRHPAMRVQVVSGSCKLRESCRPNISQRLGWVSSKQTPCLPVCRVRRQGQDVPHVGREVGGDLGNAQGTKTSTVPEARAFYWHGPLQ